VAPLTFFAEGELYKRQIGFNVWAYFGPNDNSFDHGVSSSSPKYLKSMADNLVSIHVGLGSTFSNKELIAQRYLDAYYPHRFEKD